MWAARLSRPKSSNHRNERTWIFNTEFTEKESFLRELCALCFMCSVLAICFLRCHLRGKLAFSRRVRVIDKGRVLASS
jgi:hypothetical protein